MKRGPPNILALASRTLDGSKEDSTVFETWSAFDSKLPITILIFFIILGHYRSSQIIIPMWYDWKNLVSPLQLFLSTKLLRICIKGILACIYKLYSASIVCKVARRSWK